MALGAFLFWVLAGAVVTNSTWLFPAALGVLVSSKAYGITKAAAAPRLVPEGVTLVKTNARLGLAGVVGAAVSAPIAGLDATFGPEWSLRYRSEEHTSELQSLMRISYAVFCLKKKKK